MTLPSLSLLLRRDFALLWWGGLISFLGNWMLRVALPITVLELTGDPTAMAAIVAASVAPSLLAGPIAGVVADRWDRRKVMAVAGATQAAALLPLLLVHDAGDVWICAVVTLVVATVAPFAGAAENALLPTLVEDAQLPAANSLNSLNNNLARLVGPVVGGVLAVWLGLAGVAIVDAVTFLAAAGLVLAVRTRAVPRRTGPRNGPLRDFTDGIRVITGSRTLLVLLGFFAVQSIGEGVFGTLLPAYAGEVLGGGAPELGWLSAGQAVGGVIGGLVGGWFGARISPRVLLSAAMVLFGLIDLAIFNYPHFVVHVAPGVVLMAVVGVPAVLVGVAAMTLIQRATADEYRGRVFAALGTATAGCQLIGTGLVVVLTDRLGVIGTLNVQGVTAVLAGIGAILLLPRAVTAPPEKSTCATAVPG